jgi:predicted DNA-binding transcriptional regulator AlpA
MPGNESMTVDERYKYLRILHQRYEGANRAKRAALLDEAEAVTGLHRKYLYRLLNRPGPIRKPRTRQRGPHYSGQALHAVAVVAEALDWICAERLQPALAETAAHLARFGVLELTPTLREELAALSVSTVYRVLRRLRQDQPRLPQRRGRASRGLMAQIPAGRLPWDLSAPGCFEVDLVHHGGPVPRADYVCTLQWVDVATGWSERVAVLGRSHRAMIAAFDQVVARCPFPIRAIHPDNGAEFLNRPLLAHFGARVPGVQLTRSRPWQKNDNRFVEQKNATLVAPIAQWIECRTSNP